MTDFSDHSIALNLFDHGWRASDIEALTREFDIPGDQAAVLELNLDWIAERYIRDAEIFAEYIDILAKCPNGELRAEVDRISKAAAEKMEIIKRGRKG